MTVHTETVFEVRVRSARALRDAMDYRRYSVRTLAAAVERDLLRQRKRGLGKSGLGNLLTGVQKTTRSEVARSIEDLLDVAAGSLFEARVSNVSRETRRNQTGSTSPLVAAMMFVGVAFAMLIVLLLGQAIVAQSAGFTTTVGVSS